MATGANDTGDAQVPPTRETGAGSATGTALMQQDHEIPKGDDRGSKIEIIGGEPQPDLGSPKATGAQLEPARFTSNGSLPHNVVGTPTGALPVGALGLSPEESQTKVDESNAAHDAQVAARGTRQRLSPATVQRVGATELTAIAQQRGYDLPVGGARATRASFLKAQDADTEIDDGGKPKRRSPRKASKKRSASSRRR